MTLIRPKLAPSFLFELLLYLCLKLCPPPAEFYNTHVFCKSDWHLFPPSFLTVSSFLWRPGHSLTPSISGGAFSSPFPQILAVKGMGKMGRGVTWPSPSVIILSILWSWMGRWLWDFIIGCLDTEAFCSLDYRLWPPELLPSKLYLLGGNKSAAGENEINKEKQKEKHSWETRSPEDAYYLGPQIQSHLKLASPSSFPATETNKFSFCSSYFNLSSVTFNQESRLYT